MGVVTTFFISPALDSSGFCGSTCFSSTGLFARSVFSCFLKPFPSFLAMARSCSYSSKAILSLLFLLLHVQDSKDVWWFLHKSQIVEILEGYLTIIHRLSWAIRKSSEKVVFELISVMQPLITFQDWLQMNERYILNFCLLTSFLCRSRSASKLQVCKDSKNFLWASWKQRSKLH